MNAKRCKFLRRMARRVPRLATDTTYVAKLHSKRNKEFIIPLSGLIGPLQVLKYQTCTFVLHPQCVRACYQRLKGIAT